MCPKVDAIQRTSRRLVPVNKVESVDSQFSGSWDRDTMIGTARDLVQNFSLTRGIIGIRVNNVVGSGPTMSVKTKDSAFNTSKERMWRAWTRDCDA